MIYLSLANTTTISSMKKMMNIHDKQQLFTAKKNQFGKGQIKEVNECRYYNMIIKLEIIYTILGCMT